VAFATAAALVPLIGVVALGAEAGSWYVTRQHAYNAADAAAYAGALRLACTISGEETATCDAQTVAYRGKELAAVNGFCNTGDTSYTGSTCTSLPNGISRVVQIDIGDYSAGTFTTPPAANGNAVRAKVSQQQPAYLASLLGLTTVNIPGQAVAVIEQPSKLCALSLGPNPNGAAQGALKIAGNSSNNGSGCPMMSDATVQLASTPSFTGTGWALLGATGCSPTTTCASVSVAHDWFMPYAVDPLQNLKSESFNSLTSTGPPNDLSCSGTLTPNNPPNSTNLYRNLTCTNGNAVTFSSGTYFFYNGTIRINNGASVTGTGVTLVLLGNTNITINGGFNLSAPTSNGDLSGVLIDDQATGSVNIGGNGTIKLGGAMYFPNTSVSIGGTTQPDNTTCSEVIAKTLTITGNAYLSSDNCVSSTIAHTQIVRLVQ
jgi:hypothetical protein